jgi:hypothetical protein
MLLLMREEVLSEHMAVQLQIFICMGILSNITNLGMEPVYIGMPMVMTILSVL